MYQFLGRSFTVLVLLLTAVCNFQLVSQAQVRTSEQSVPPVPSTLSLPASQQGYLISQVSIKAERTHTEGRECPVYVSFHGQIRAFSGISRPEVNVNYHWFGDRSYKSPVFQTKVKRGETQSVFWKRQIEAAPPPGSGQNRKAAPGVKPKLPIFEGWTSLAVTYYKSAYEPSISIVSGRAEFTVDCYAAPPPPPKLKGK